ncbi:MAG: glycosyltransferase family 4 protein [Candidatus Eisenbacteria bacterium]|nr:glycosyltransferase family 4 protein [Candidatus Eisenbacteria bacterium]
MKILYLNNYPMDEAWRLWEAGKYPGNHLFGTTHLGRHGIEVRIAPYRVHTWLASLGRWLRLGDLDQQYRALFSGCDLVYSACQGDTLGLAMLRSAGLLRRPLVATVHAPFRPGLERWVARAPYSRGHDQLICLGPAVEHHMREVIGFPRERLHMIPWGVDLDFYRREFLSEPPSGPLRILSAGKTARDHETLVRAVDGIACELTLVTSGRHAPPRGSLPSNVRVIAGPGDEFALTYPELIAAYQRAHVVAVPLLAMRHPRGQTGGTSLLEAMAMGRPVLVTRTELMPLDIESEGVGLWVGPGDVTGWRHAIRRLLDDPGEARRMGSRGRWLCETRYNMEEFGARLAGVLWQALPRRGGAPPGRPRPQPDDSRGRP